MKNYNSVTEKIKGPLIPIMPAFDSDGALDLESTCKWVNWLIERGIRLLWTTYGTSHYICLTDAEVMELTEAVAQVTKGRAIFIASSAYHWSTLKCISFVEFAAGCGVDIVKLQIDWSWRPTEDMVFEHYRKIAESSALPLFAYTNIVPAVTGGMTNSLLKRILDLPQFVGMKNDSGDFYEHSDYLRTIRQHGGEFTPVTGGSMRSFLYGYNFGARAFASGLGMIAPHLPISFAAYLNEGKQDMAVKIIREYEEPIQSAFAAIGAYHACCHAVLMLNGLFRSHCIRFPWPTLNKNEVESVKKCLAVIDISKVV